MIWNHKMSRLNEVAPDVFRLGNELFNWYLIKDGYRFTLVDAGFPTYWDQLVDTLRRLGGSIESIDAVLITHAHLDHVGLAARVRKESGATIYLHASDQRRAARGGAQMPPRGLLLNAWRRHPFRMLMTAVFYHRVFLGPAIRDFQPLRFEDGPLDIPGSPLPIFVPGHTEGSAAFWFEDHKVLAAGDALVTVNLLTGADTGPQLTSKGTEDDWQKAQESLEAFAELGEAVLLTGHGNPWCGDLRDAVAMARKRLTKPY